MKAVFALSAVGLALALTACPGVPQADGGLRFVNAVSDSGGMKVFFGDTRKNTEGLLGFRLPYPSTGYVAQAPGTSKYSLCDDNQIECTLKNFDLTVKSGVNSSIIAVGTLSSADDTGTSARPLELVKLEDTTELPSNGQTKLRVIHAVTGAESSPVNIYVTKPDEALGGFVPSLAYKEVLPYTETTAGTWQIRLTPKNKTTPVLVDSGPLTLASGKVYTVVLTNPNAGNGGAVLLTDK